MILYSNKYFWQKVFCQNEIEASFKKNYFALSSALLGEKHTYKAENTLPKALLNIEKHKLIERKLKILKIKCLSDKRILNNI